MTNETRELNIDELAAVTGGGLVDKVLPESEAATNEFLKKFAEAAVRFNAFINAPPANQPPPVAN
jgi:bacteriocin-like protein